VFRFTSHDYPLDVDGETYLVPDAPQHSNERRETGMKDANMSIFGAIASAALTSSDLDGRKFDDAEVLMRVVNWRWPWRKYYYAQKWVVKTSRDGVGYTLDLVGVTKFLTQPVGGRFGGFYSPVCPYTLGDAATCKRDLTALTQTSTVLSVSGLTTKFRGNTGTWTTPPFSTIIQTVTISDTTDLATWPTPHNMVTGSQVKLTGGGGAAGLDLSGATIYFLLVVSPTTAKFGISKVNVTAVSPITINVTTPSTPTVTCTPTGVIPDDYFKDGTITWTSGLNSGLKSPIAAYTDSTRECTLLIPTPYAIQVGDAFTAKPGCDGTRNTCGEKFGNIVNFGGLGVFTPGSAPAMEVPT
jgi:hypothetical protein